MMKGQKSRKVRGTCGRNNTGIRRPPLRVTRQETQGTPPVIFNKEESPKRTNTNNRKTSTRERSRTGIRKTENQPEEHANKYRRVT